MADKSAIEWTNGTWNPTTGCTKVSEECANCYAEKLHSRLSAMGQKKYQKPFGEFVEHESEIDRPLQWKSPRMIFVNSMSDLFHQESTYSFLSAVFHTMCIASQHTYQVLTKRPGKMLAFSNRWIDETGRNEIPDNIWLGVSCGTRKSLPRIDVLRKIPVKVRFVSFEPLLEDLDTIDLTSIAWAIVGGESGPNFRPLRKEWVLNIQKQCDEQRVAFFFKQWGGIRPKSGGREIDGKTWDEYPSVVQSKSKFSNFLEEDEQ